MNIHKNLTEYEKSNSQKKLQYKQKLTIYYKINGRNHSFSTHNTQELSQTYIFDQ